MFISSLTFVQRQNLLLFNKLVSESLARKLALSPTEESVPEQDDHDSLDSDRNNDNNDNNNDKATRKDGGERSWCDSKFWEFIDTLLDEMCVETELVPVMCHKKEWER